MTAWNCPEHRTPLVTHGEACPACDGAGTVLGYGLWADYCDACRGSGLRYWCPACERERDEETEAQEEARYLRYLEGTRAAL